MKIAFLVSRFPSPSETFILRQLTGLIDRGHDVRIFADCADSPDRLHEDIEAYRLMERTHYPPVLSPRRLRRVMDTVGLAAQNFLSSPGVVLGALDFVRRGRSALNGALMHASIPFLGRTFDVVHCHFGPNGRLAAELREIGALKGKILTTFHGIDVNAGVFSSEWYAPLFRRGDAYTVNTDYTARRAEELGCPAERITKLPVGLDLERFPYRPRRVEADGTIRLLTVARLVEKKGLIHSIRAVATLVGDFPGLHYDIVGDGPQRELLEREIEELGVAGRIHLVGWKTESEVRLLFDAAHLFVLPSVTAANGDKEGQGLVLQEAQAMGLPVISTLHNGIPEGVLDGRSGLLVPEGDVPALAGALGELLAAPGRWAEMGREGHELVGRHYDIEVLNDRLVEIYERMVAE